MTELPIACTLAESELRARQGGVLEQMRDLAKEVTELEAGDKVMVEMSPYDLSKGRITFRQK